MRTDIMINFRFMHNQEGRLNIHKVVGRVLCALPNSLKGFIPSVLKPNLMFLASPESLQILHQCFSTNYHLHGVLAYHLSNNLLCSIAST
jgi:hypothetical protein